MYIVPYQKNKQKTHSKMSEGQKTGIISNTGTIFFIPIYKHSMELHLDFIKSFAAEKKCFLRRTAVVQLCPSEAEKRFLSYYGKHTWRI